MYTDADIEKMIKQAVRRTAWKLDRITQVEKQKVRVYLMIPNSEGKPGMKMNFALGYRERLFEYQDNDDKLGNLTVFAVNLDQMAELIARLLP